MRKLLLFITPLLLILVSCDTNRLDVDVSDIKTPPLKLMRLENDLFALNPTNIDAGTRDLKTKYGIYYEHYLMNFLSRNGTADTAYKPAILSFTQDRDIRNAYKAVKALYPDEKLKALLPQVDDCVKRFKYHFPKKRVPTRLITCISGWNYAFSYMDSSLILSLDRYLGDTSMFYGMLRYPQYQTRRMNEQHILPDIARGWLLTEFDNDNAQNILLNHAIFYGKLYYAVNALLPHTQDSLVIGYTKKQIAYCKEFEKKLWGFFAEKNRLYENNLSTVRELTSEGPFTGAISKDCPPRIAMWVGWQIVRSYMKNNEKVTLEELMNERDAKKILNRSKYRP